MKQLLVISLVFLALQCSSQNYNVSKAKFNTNYSEYCAGLMNDQVIFSSNRKPEVLKTYLDENDNYYTNLYISSKDEKGNKTKTEVFSAEISSVLNEGSLSFEPDGRSFWYTSNISHQEKRVRENRDYMLGIFKAQKRDGKWERVQSFPWNSKNQEFNVAHPAISPDGTFMIFSSDMEGGFGESDLYISYRIDLEWSKPELLHEGINTAGNELFPYLDSQGVLYFSSNGIVPETGLDVYSTTSYRTESYKAPVRMRAPINTEFDDYAFMIKEDGETGYLSSNRENLNDDVYEFKYMYPEFNGCSENFKPYMCYMIEESNLTYNDTLPLAYIWDFGDGTSANGFRNEHCYADTGLYKINLNIIDTITGVTFATVSDMELLIEQPNQPYITSPDTLIINEEAVFSSIESTFNGFELSEWFWDMGSEKKLRGEEVSYAFTAPGIYEVVLGALSVPDESGYHQKACVYKPIVVVENQAEWDLLREIGNQKAIEDQEALEAYYREEERAYAEALEAEEKAKQALENGIELIEPVNVENLAEVLSSQEITESALDPYVQPEEPLEETLAEETLVADALDTATVEEQVEETLANEETQEEVIEALEESIVEDLTEAKLETEEFNTEETAEETLVADALDTATSEEPVEETLANEEVEEEVLETLDEILASETTAEGTNSEPKKTILENGFVLLDYAYLDGKQVNAGDPENTTSSEKAESLYFVDVKESEQPMELDDPYFDKLNHQVTERVEDDSVYVYSVGQAREVFALWDVYKEVLDSGYTSAIVKQEKLKIFTTEVEIAEELRPEKDNEESPSNSNEEWNRTITQFANIQFGKNSAYVSKETYASLDYIAAILMIEEDFKLKIDAYTDSSGNPRHNLELSKQRAENVKKYLIRKGIDQNRLISEGYGDAKPISSNETEPGRAINRRVEFEIITDLFKN